MIDMPQAVGTTGVKRPANYSHCPLKKRPIKYVEQIAVAMDYSSDSSDHTGPILVQHDSDSSEPENLSTKPEDLRLVNTEAKIASLSTSPPRVLQQIRKEKEIEIIKLERPAHSTCTLTLLPSPKVIQQIHSQILGNANAIRTLIPPAQSQQQQQSLPLSSPPAFSSTRHLPIPPPPPLKVFSSNHQVNGNGRPLEPISFNPQVSTSVTSGWSSGVSPFLPFNFLPPTSTSVHGHGQLANSRHHQQQHQHHPQVPSHGHNANTNSFSPYPTSASTKIPFYNHHHQLLQQHHQSHFAPQHHRSQHKHHVIGSPPHVSPPLNNEPSYPAGISVRQETAHHQHQQRHYPAGEFTKFNLHSQHYSVAISPKETHAKREMREIQAHSLHNRETLINVKRNSFGKDVKINPGLLSHSHSEGVNRSRSLSSGSCSDRSSPIPDSSSLSPCSTTGNSVSSSITPTNVNGSIRYQCPDCNKSYSTFSGLSKHLQFHCASQNKKSFICKFCDKVYVSLGALKMHIRTHTLPCKCTICGKAFSRPWLLQGHIRTHTGEKPFSCDFCHRAFADRSNLRAHLQTHSEVKKYSCQSCSKTFSRTSLLAKHKDSGCGHGSA